MKHVLMVTLLILMACGIAALAKFMASTEPCEPILPVGTMDPRYPSIMCCLYNKSGNLQQDERDPGTVVICNRHWQPCSPFYYDEEPDDAPPKPTSSWTEQ